MSSKDTKVVSTKSNSDDETTHVPGLMVESSKKKDLKKFDFVTEDGEHVYKEDDTSEIIHEFKASDLHHGEWREVVKACPNKKGKGCLSVYKQIQERMDYLCTTKAELGIDLDRPLTNKMLKLSVQYEDHLAGTVLNEPVLEIFFRLHQGPGLDDHARTFSSLLLAEIDKRNLNPLKQMRVIEQLRQ
ncbi:hypothetical protein Tco_0412695 [Tanacetum coccineum]